MVGPDFSDVDSKAKALELVAKGVLEPMHLMPVEFGGDDREPNIVYVPVGLAAVKSNTDTNVVLKLAEEGRVTQYHARPQYVGRSFVPTSIEVIASEPGTFVFTIEVWGEGLEANRA